MKKQIIILLKSVDNFKSNGKLSNYFLKAIVYFLPEPKVDPQTGHRSLDLNPSDFSA